MQELIKYFAKFSAVGIIAFVIDYTLLVVFTEVFNIDYLWSTTFAFIISVLFSYAASMRFIYAPREDLTGRSQVLIYFFLSTIGLVINDVLMFLFTDVAGIIYLISKLLADLIVSVWNFWSRRHWLDANARPAKMQARLDKLDSNLEQWGTKLNEYQDQLGSKLNEYQDQLGTKINEYQDLRKHEKQRRRGAGRDEGAERGADADAGAGANRDDGADSPNSAARADILAANTDSNDSSHT